jgi:hypothetical protein
MTVSVRLATLQDLEQLVPLFDGYRQFYGKPSDLELARRFLSDRLAKQDVRLVAVTRYPRSPSGRGNADAVLGRAGDARAARGRGAEGLTTDLERVAERRV